MIFISSKNNPILKPNKKHNWEGAKVYNCGAIFHNKKYHLFYRAVNLGKNRKSTIGYAVSNDGINFKRFAKPLLLPKGRLETRGLEDPRITKIDDKFYIAFAAYDGITPRLNTATSKNLTEWRRNGRSFSNWRFKEARGIFIKWENGYPVTVSQPNEWSKSGGIFPEKIANEFWMLFGEFKMWFACSKDGKKWRADNRPFITPRKGKYFDNNYIEMGPPPIKTKKGWLVLYHGIDKKFTYQLGYLLLNLNEPRKILYRSTNPIFSPVEAGKLPGTIDIASTKHTTSKNHKENRQPKVIFCNGAVLIKDTLRIYYGINDTYIGTATAKLKDILESK